MTLLSVQDVRGGYGGGTDILNGVSFSLVAGKILTIAGSNGAGKSTLAKAIVGLLPDLRGQIVFQGTELTSLPTEERIALVVHRIEGLSLHDAAIASGMSLSTFKRRLAKGEARFMAPGGPHIRSTPAPTE